ncbi:acetyltransferase [Fulvitalea axinellae]|uniref:Acetyltransferase n=1 Tax=Fulvitalea axinellae TaxID=1182444 RepID=A0AAU9CLI9_9BACT|nr:acetyltransferase [Fulvitalea axinellae]
MREKHAFKFLPFYMLSALPMVFLYAISKVSYFVMYYIVGYRRFVVRENLRKAFPAKKEDELVSIEKNFYRHFMDLIFEALKGLTISKKKMQKRVKIKNLNIIDKIHQENKSVILYTAHYGNWEWLSILPEILPYKVTTIYQPLSNGYFDQLMRLIRGRFGVDCVESGRCYKTILQNKRENTPTIYIVVGDQSPTQHGSKLWVDFMKIQTAFLEGAERIARKTEQVILYPSMKKSGKGAYEIEFKWIDDAVKSKTKAQIVSDYSQFLEKDIETHPSLWLWSHRRWKLSV